MLVAEIKNNVVVEMMEINRPIADYPQVYLVEAGEEVVIGFTHSNGIFTPHETHQAELDAETQRKSNLKAKEYLASTDWMLLREMDGGKAMTAEVKLLRADARTKVVNE